MARARKTKKKGKGKMADESLAPSPDGGVIPPISVDKVDLKNDLQLEIEGANDGLSLTVFVRAPLLAEVIRKMTPTNYEKAKYAKYLQPILLSHEKNADYAVTRGAISKATKNFVGAVAVDFNEPPPAIMLANPDALAAGYTLTVKLEKPCPPDTIKRWGKQFMDGCGEILTAARPYKFAWVMQQVPVYK